MSVIQKPISSVINSVIQPAIGGDAIGGGAMIATETFTKSDGSGLDGIDLLWSIFSGNWGTGDERARIVSGAGSSYAGPTDPVFSSSQGYVKIDVPVHNDTRNVGMQLLSAGSDFDDGYMFWFDRNGTNLDVRLQRKNGGVATPFYSAGEFIIPGTEGYSMALDVRREATGFRLKGYKEDLLIFDYFDDDLSLDGNNHVCIYTTNSLNRIDNLIASTGAYPAVDSDFVAALDAITGLETHLRLNTPDGTDRRGNYTWTLSGASATGGLLQADFDGAASFDGTNDTLTENTGVNNVYNSADGFSVGFLASEIRLAGGDSFFGIGLNGDDDPLVTLFSTSDGEVRLFIRDLSGTVLVDETSSWDGLGAAGTRFIVVTCSASGDYNVYVDNQVVLTGSFVKPSIAYDRASFGCTYRTSDGNHMEVVLDECFVYSKELSADEVSSLNDALLVASSQYPVYTLSANSETIIDPADLAGGDTKQIIVDLPHASRVAFGFVGEIGDSADFVVDPPGANNGSVGNVNDDRVFGKAALVDNFHAGLVTEEMAAGKNAVTIVNQSGAFNPWLRIWIATGSEKDGFVGDTVNAYGAPTVAKKGSEYFAVRSELFSDDRYVTKYGAEKSSRRLRDGYRPNDVNHAGGCVVALSNGAVLTCSTGHNNPQIECNYFASGDISAAPTTYTVGNASTSFTYPQAVELPNGNVAVYVRGNPSGATSFESHFACLFQFDPSDGSGETLDVIASPTAWRMYLSKLQVEEVSGDTLIGFLWNPRSWVSDQPERFCAAVLDVTNSQVYGPDGTTIGGTSLGTVATPRISDADLMATVASGGCLLKDKDPADNALQGLDADSGVFDLSGGPTEWSVYFPYIIGPTAEAAGGYQSDVEFGHLSCVDGTITDHGTFTPSVGDPVATFCTAALRLVSSTEAQMILGTRTTQLDSNVESELSSPYYDGWGGGDELILYRVNNPFSSSPTLTELDVVDVAAETGGRTIANIVNVGSAAGEYCGMLRYRGLSTHGRRVPALIFTTGNQITVSANNT